VVAYDNVPKKGTYKSVSFTKDKQKINKQNVMNVAYANKLGNGDSKSGDGYRYRGRGAIQITGKSVYDGVGSKCNELFGTNYDFTSNPDIVTEPITTVQSAVAYFIWKGKDIGKNILEIMDKDNSFNVTKVVNSAGLEKETRNRKYKDFLSSIYFDCKPKK
jgi:putative chitinase